MGTEQAAVFLVVASFLAVTGCQNNVDVPPPAEGMTGIFSGPTGQASPVPGAQGSDNGTAGSTNNDTGTLPNAPNVDAGHVGFNGGPTIGLRDSGSAFNGGPVNTGTQDAGITGTGF